MKKKKPQYSFSRLDLYGRCPWAFKTVYLDKIPRAESEALKIGSDSHKHVGDYLSRLVNTGQSTDWAWAEGLLTLSDHPDVVEIVQRFVENFVLPPSIEAPGIENKLAFDANWQPCEFFSEAAYFRMVIDFHFRQEALGVITDWKTNRAMPETVEKDLQLRTYGWGLKRALYPDIAEVLLRLHFLRYGREREVLLTPQDLAGVPEELQARIEVIEADQTFTPTPGSFCGMCGVTAHCPVMAQALVPVEVLAPATREQAEKAASLLLTLQNLEKELAARLKEYVREFGPVQVGDLVYGPVLGVDYDLDPKTVTDQLLEMGYPSDNVWKVLTIGKTSLDRGLKELGLIGKRSKERKALVEQFLAAAPSKTTEKIGFSKVKELP
jgi:hypothetical protein